MAWAGGGKFERPAILICAALLLWGCPKEQKGATISFAADGRPVFDGKRGDCFVRYSVTEVEGAGQRTSIWSADAPMPVSNQGPCALGFPVTYGEAPGARATFPETAPPLRPGVRYVFSAEGVGADYSAEFQLP